MRRVLEGDVSVVAQVLRGLPPAQRPLRLARLIASAEAADRHRRRTGRPHPLWGTGSLMAAASGMPRGAGLDFEDDEDCRCWVMVLEALIRHRARKARRYPAAQETQSGVVGSISSRLSGISSPHSRHSP